MAVATATATFITPAVCVWAGRPHLTHYPTGTHTHTPFCLTDGSTLSFIFMNPASQNKVQKDFYCLPWEKLSWFKGN